MSCEAPRAPAPSPAPEDAAPPPLVPQAPKTDELAAIRSDLTYLTHHVYRLVLAMQVPPCTCETCSRAHVDQSNLILSLAAATASTPPAVAHANGNCSSHESDGGSACQTPEAARLTIADREYDTDMSSEDAGGTPAGALDPAMLQSAGGLLAGLSPEQLTALLGSASPAPASPTLVQGGGPLRAAPKRARGNNVGRRSKYCTAEEKTAVATYATIHGASAAGRKFNIPPAVAAYYHRKLYNRALPKGRRPLLGEGGQEQPLAASGELSMVPGAFPVGEDSNGSFNSDQGLNSTGNNGLGARVGTGKRGRPKLIGDDVDADLLTYLVKLRRTNPDIRLSADSVLSIATAFIRQRTPGLLVEDGGSVQLRPTWAMKMLMRINEWERLMPSADALLSPSKMDIVPKLEPETSFAGFTSPGATATVLPTSPGNSPPMGFRPMAFPPQAPASSAQLPLAANTGIVT